MSTWYSGNLPFFYSTSGQSVFRSINSKFYLIAFLLTLSFGFGYAILAYFQLQQQLSSRLAQEAIVLERDISTLTELFSEIRFWEKVLLTQNEAVADIRFGKLTEDISHRLKLLQQNNSDPVTDLTLKQIASHMENYGSAVSHLIQLKTQQRLQAAQMETSYRSMVSVILATNNIDLYKPLFNFTHFFLNYQTAKDFPKYQALKLVGNALGSAASSPANDSRLINYMKTFDNLLNENFQTELDITERNHKVEELNQVIRASFGQISISSEQRLAGIMQESEKIRLNLQHLFTLSSFLGILVLLIILAIISRNIILPIRSIARVMQQVKSGELQARFASSKESKDEIHQFGRAFNEMLDTLEDNNLTLMQYQQQLEQKINELSEREQESRQLAAQLQRVEKMEAIGTLAGGVAHDLNNILSGIVSYPELLLLDMPKDSPYRKSIEIIQQSGQKAASIVQDLLTLARRGVPVWEVTNLNRLVEEYLASPVYTKLTDHNPEISIDFDLQSDLFNIKGSPVHLAKTIMNLISNAVESLKGPGKVIIRTENRYISLPIVGYDNVKQGDYAVLSVADTGSGIGAADMDKIFEPFFTRKVMGTSGSGLGLAVVWGTVKDHQGYIDVQSSAGKGTTFTLYFPITREEFEVSEDAPPLETYMGHGESVLVVDDVESQRKIASAMLTKLGYRVTTVASGEEAILQLQREPADILVLDMLMPPGIDGLETYKQALALYPGQPAIIASGYSETERVRKTQKLGAAMYIKKPYSIEQIGLAVQTGLQPKNN